MPPAPPTPGTRAAGAASPSTPTAASTGHWFATSPISASMTYGQWFAQSVEQYTSVIGTDNPERV